MSLLCSCLDTLRDTINRHILLGNTISHTTLSPYRRLQSALGFAYLHLAQRKRFRQLRPFVLRPRLLQPEAESAASVACVYLLVRYDGPADYIGKTVDDRQRLAQHTLAVKRRAFSPGTAVDDAAADYFHYRASRIGLGSFVYLRLADFGPARQWGADLRPLLDSVLLHREATCIQHLSLKFQGTLNTRGTWRQQARMRCQLRSLTAAPPERRPKRVNVALQWSRRVPLQLAVPGLRLSRRRTLYRTYILEHGGAQLLVHDLYLLVRHLAGTTSLKLPLTLAVRSAGVDLCTRYSNLQRHYSQSQIEVLWANGERRRTTLAALTSAHLDDARQLTFISVVRQPVLSAGTRKALALLSYSYEAKHVFYKRCSISLGFRVYRKCVRISNSKKRGSRLQTIIATMRKKFGLHPALKHIIRVTTPYCVTRADVQRQAAHIIRQWSPWDAVTTDIAVNRRQLRAVFTAVPKVVDLFDNVRKHMREYVPGCLRPCSCHQPQFDGLWRDADG